MSQLRSQSVTVSHALADQTTMPLRSQGQKHSSTPVGARHLVRIVPNDEGELHASAMENFFQACATDEAFSLELVGTRREQGFLLRASSEEQLVLLCKQLCAQYP